MTTKTLINDEIAALISKTKRCDTVQVSIDGLVPATYDTFRGMGVFEKAIQGLKLLTFVV